MQAIQNSYHGFTLLVGVNWDRLIYPATIAASLLLGAFIGTLIIG
jgi:hypothetical protein